MKLGYSLDPRSEESGLSDVGFARGLGRARVIAQRWCGRSVVADLDAVHQYLFNLCEIPIGRVWSVLEYHVLALDGFFVWRVGGRLESVPSVDGAAPVVLVVRGWYDHSLVALVCAALVLDFIRLPTNLLCDLGWAVVD